MEPSLDEWRRLYTAAVEFRDAGPWDWMSDADVFGVQDPETGEIGYCCIMGQLGQQYALAAYRGSEGLAALWKMRLGPEPEEQDPAELLALQDCVMASFEDRSELARPDLDTIKALGLKFRGRQIWPQFRSYRPGYAPWYVTAGEARFLTVCLPEALDVARRFLNDPRLLPEPAPNGRYLVRVPERRGDEWEWKDTLQRPAPVRREVAAPALDEDRLRRLRETLPTSNGVMEIDCFYAPTPVKGEDDERPYLPQIVLAADARSGFILSTEIARPGATPATLVEQVLAVAERMGMRPKELKVRRDEVAAILQPVADRLRVRLRQVRRLPAIDSARGELTGFLRGGFP